MKGGRFFLLLFWAFQQETICCAMDYLCFSRPVGGEGGKVHFKIFGFGFWVGGGGLKCLTWMNGTEWNFVGYGVRGVRRYVDEGYWKDPRGGVGRVAGVLGREGIFGGKKGGGVLVLQQL